jgi:hypothetical protein
MFSAPSGLFACDVSLGDVTGDGAPEMAIGRLPALTAADLQYALDKIVAYEDGGAWKNRAMLVADNPDDGGDFSAYSDSLLPLVAPGVVVDRIYLSGKTLDQARTAIQGGLAGGRGLLNFVGHSGMDRIAQEGLLTTADLPALRNGTNAPLILAMTCILNRFDIPGFDGFGESWVRTNAGAVAVWAPVCAAYNGDSTVFNAEFFRQLYRPDAARIGDAAVAALKSGAAAGWQPYMLQTYNLLGDPATAFGSAAWTTPVTPDERDVLPVSYEEWQRINFAPVVLADAGVTGAAADPDGDGISNAMEYRLNLDPRDGGVQAGLKVAAKALWGSDHTPRYGLVLPVRQTVSGDPTLTVEVCEDLAAPAWRATSYEIVERRDAGMGMQEWMICVGDPAGAADRLFVRIRVHE